MLHMFEDAFLVKAITGEVGGAPQSAAQVRTASCYRHMHRLKHVCTNLYVCTKCTRASSMDARINTPCSVCVPWCMCTRSLSVHVRVHVFLALLLGGRNAPLHHLLL